MNILPAAIVFTTLFVVATEPASAGSVAEKNYERIQQAWEKARAAGGYGNPFVAVPKAVVAAVAGDERQEDDRAAESEAG